MAQHTATPLHFHLLFDQAGFEQAGVKQVAVKQFAVSQMAPSVEQRCKMIGCHTVCTPCLCTGPGEVEEEQPYG
jgi:hypothetical protein